MVGGEMSDCFIGDWDLEKPWWSAEYYYGLCKIRELFRSAPNGEITGEVVRHEV